MTTATAETETSHGSTEVGRDWLPGLAAALAATAAIELIILRLGTRTLIHIPGIEWAEGPFTAMAELGRLTFSIAVVLLVMLLAGMALWSARAGRIVEAGAVAVFGLAALAARLGFVDSVAVITASTVAVIVLGVSAARHSPLFQRRWRARLPLLLLGTAVVLFGIRALSVGATTAGLPSSNPALLVVAEAFALAGLILLPLVTGRPDRAALITAFAVGLAIWVGLTVADATVKILFLWNLGLAGSLPSLAYAVAGATVTAAAVTAARSGRTELMIAILALVAAGFAIQNTYQSALVVAAVGILATAETTRLSSTRAPTARLSRDLAA